MNQQVIPLVQISFSDEELDSIKRVIGSGNLVYGQVSKQLEEDFCSYIGSSFSHLVNSGTSALIVALKALDIGFGDEVIVPAFSYIATANVVELVGAKPIFIDIELEDFNISVNKIEQAITPKTKAIIAVHEFGQPANIEAIAQIAKNHNLKLIEDAACGLGSYFNNKHVGNFGDIGTISFHPRKAITSGDGGLVVTNIENLSKKIALLLNHGQERIAGKISFEIPGFNFRITEFQSQMLKIQLKRFLTDLEKKQDIARIFLRDFEKIRFITLPKIYENRKHSWQSFHILLSPEFDRDLIIQKLKEKGVQSSLGAQCIPSENFYSKKYKYDIQESFPNSFYANKQGLVIPIFGDLTFENIKYVSDCLIRSLDE